MNAYSPVRLAILFDGDVGDIQSMGCSAVSQLASTANFLGRELLVKGAQTMDLKQGNIINWSDWVPANMFDSSRAIRSAICYRSNDMMLGALHPLAIENEILLTVDPLSMPPRYVAQRIDAILIATGREPDEVAKELGNKALLKQILFGKQPSELKGPMGLSPRVCRPEDSGHRGLIKQGSRVFGLATHSGAEESLDALLSKPTKGASFHGNSEAMKQLIDAVAIVMADPEGARLRLESNAFAPRLLTHNRT